MKKLAVVLVLVALVWFFARRSPTPKGDVPLSQVETSVEKRDPSLSGLPEAKPVVRRTPKRATTPPPPELAEKFDLVASLLADNRRQDAIDLLQEILRANPDSPDALYQMAYVLVEDPARREEALGMLKKALEKDPNHEPAMAELLDLAQGGGAAESIYQGVKTAYERNPQSANVAAGLGRLAVERGDPQAAIPLLEQGAKDPYFAQSSLNSLIDAYRDTGAYAKATETYERLIRFQEEMMAKADAEEAAVYQQEINSSRLGLVETLIATGQLDAADRVLQQVRTRDPENPSITSLQLRLDQAKAG